MTPPPQNSVEGIRKAAIWAQGRLCKVWYKCVVAMGTDGREDLEYLLNSTFLSFAATVRTDCDRSVVIATLEMLEDLLKSLKVFSPFPLTEKPLSSLLVSLHDIFNNKVYTVLHVGHHNLSVWACGVVCVCVVWCVCVCGVVCVCVCVVWYGVVCVCGVCGVCVCVGCVCVCVCVCVVWYGVVCVWCVWCVCVWAFGVVCVGV